MRMIADFYNTSSVYYKNMCDGEGFAETLVDIYCGLLEIRESD